MLERWERVLSRRIRLIQPTFRSMQYKRRRLPKATDGAAHGTEVTDIWSGAVVHAPAGDSFKWIEGEWTVPNAFPPPGAVDGFWYSASTWIGIDGIDGSGDVLQAGCDSDVMTSGGTIQRQLNPWWEWFPAGSFWIGNLPVAQGDTMDGLICVTAGSTTSATIFLLNVTSGVGASFNATALPGSSLAGNSAEWVGTRQPLAHSDGRVTPLTLDVTQAAQTQAAAERVESLDILINNAGLGLYDDLSDRAALEQHLAVNLGHRQRSVGDGLCRLAVHSAYSISKAGRPDAA